MSDVLQNMSFSDRQYISEIIDFVDSLIIKCNYDATEFETVDSKRDGDAYTLAKLKRDSLFDYKLSSALIRAAGLNVNKANSFNESPENFFKNLTKSESDRLLDYLRIQRINNYVEKNPYYLLLNGEPSDESEVVIIRDIYEDDTVPLHKINEDSRPLMYQHLTNYDNQELNKIISDLRDRGKDYGYLKYLSKKTSYEISRGANNFDILWHDENIINNQDMHVFFEEYAKARDYVLTVPYIQAYAETMELYDRFITVTILFITILNFLSLRIDSVMRNKFSTREEKILFFKDYDMESVVDQLSDSQMDLLIENMEQLIPLKGSEEVITKILELFGINNVDVYKYMLFKTIKSDPISNEVVIDPTKTKTENYNVNMVRIPISDTSKGNSTSKYINGGMMRSDPKDLMLSDKFFGDTTHDLGDGYTGKEGYYNEIISKLKNSEDFSYFYTKYLGIISHINITQLLVKATYLFQQLFHDEESLEVECSLIELPATITCRDLIAAINYIITLRFNMSDEILNNAADIARIMGFNSAPDLNELKEMDMYIIQSREGQTETISVELPNIIDESDIFIVRSRSGGSGDYGSGSGDLIVNRMDMMAMSSVYKARCVTDYEYNIKKHDELINKMENTKDYNEYTALKKVFDYNMYTYASLELFGIHETYTDYLRANAPDLLNIIHTELNSATNSIWDVPGGDSRTDAFINKCIDLISSYVDSIMTSLNPDDDVADAIKNTYVDNTSVFSRIFTIVNLFKSYTTQFTNNDVTFTINQPKDSLVRIFDMITTQHGKDTFEEPLLELIFHVFDVKSSQSDEDILQIRELLLQYYFEQYVNPRLEIQHDITEIHKNDQYDNIYEILFHKILSNNKSNDTDKLTVLNRLYTTLKHEVNHELPIQHINQIISRSDWWDQTIGVHSVICESTRNTVSNNIGIRHQLIDINK